MTTTPENEILTKLRNATDGLLFPSETDALVIPVFWPAAEMGGSLTVDHLLSQIHIPPDTPVEQVPFEDFFAGYVPDPQAVQDGEMDGVQLRTLTRLTALAGLMRDNLSDLHIYRVKEIARDIYILGRDRDQNIVGVKTSVVET